MHDHDRDAIFARRALFISTALAGLGCTTREPPIQPEPPSEQHVVAPVEVENEIEGDPVKPTDGERPSWSEIMAGIPPLDVPQGLSKTEAELLSWIESSMREKYADLERIWAELPDCAPSQADCGAWAVSVRLIRDATRFDDAPCGYATEVTNTVLERERAHQAYLDWVAARLLADLDAAAKAYTAADDVTAWDDLRRDQVHARPCLTCGVRTAVPVLERVSFDDGQAVPGAGSNRDLEDVAMRHKSNGTARLMVRGHADPSEPDPDGLAKRRAEAVAAALVQLGVRKADLDVRGYGVSLPLTRDAAQAEQNRRVDFEVLLP